MDCQFGLVIVANSNQDYPPPIQFDQINPFEGVVLYQKALIRIKENIEIKRSKGL